FAVRQQSAFCLLQDHPQVCGDRIGVIGLSFGVFLALRLASQTGINPTCVICVNGPMGSYNKLADADGRSEAFDGDQKHWTYDEQGYVSFREISSPANILPENNAKVEDVDCPILYIAGEDDLSCASTDNANKIEEALRSVGREHLFSRLSYPGAGHLIEPPYTPNARASLWSIKPKKLITLWGGHPSTHAAAQEDAWKKMLDYMESHLRG
ncbi:peroxisomal succinyl-coenzyme A thioesterase-like, partial [Diretmus argenteus]